MGAFEQTFPPLLAELHSIDIDYNDGDGIDFEPYQEFQSAEDNADWFQAWTGNKKLTGDEYRIFGQDGTGGYAAFWMSRKDKPVLEQPIVFFGSEGEVGVVASSFTDYLWLLAAGLGPYEVVAYHGEDDDDADDDDDERTPQKELVAFAKAHGGKARKPKDVIKAAKEAFPDFVKNVRAQCE